MNTRFLIAFAFLFTASAQELRTASGHAMHRVEPVRRRGELERTNARAGAHTSLPRYAETAVNAALDLVSLDDILDAVDVERLLQRVDIQRIVDHADIQNIVDRVDIDGRGLYPLLAPLAGDRRLCPVAHSSVRQLLSQLVFCRVPGLGISDQPLHLEGEHEPAVRRRPPSTPRG